MNTAPSARLKSRWKSTIWRPRIGLDQGEIRGHGGHERRHGDGRPTSLKAALPTVMRRASGPSLSEARSAGIAPAKIGAEHQDQGGGRPAPPPTAARRHHEENDGEARIARARSPARATRMPRTTSPGDRAGAHRARRQPSRSGSEAAEKSAARASSMRPSPMGDPTAISRHHRVALLARNATTPARIRKRRQPGRS